MVSIVVAKYKDARGGTIDVVEVGRGRLQLLFVRGRRRGVSDVTTVSLETVCSKLEEKGWTKIQIKVDRAPSGDNAFRSNVRQYRRAVPVNPEYTPNPFAWLPRPRR